MLKISRLKISRLGLAISAGLLGVLAPRTAQAEYPYPQSDANGDFQIVNPLPQNRQHLLENWVVVDPDPNGLNVRCKHPLAEGLDYYNLPADYVFYEGQEFSSYALRMDDRGLPWVVLEAPHKSSERINCFVRANTRFIQRSGRPVRR